MRNEIFDFPCLFSGLVLFYHLSALSSWNLQVIDIMTSTHWPEVDIVVRSQVLPDVKAWQSK